MNLSTIDPSLPGLPHLFDLPAIAKGFAGCQPTTDGDARYDPAATAGGDAWQVKRMQHLHYQPGHRGLATYELSQKPPGQPARDTLGVVECTPSGVTYRFFHADATLPGLATAVDASAMVARLGRLTPTPDKAPASTRCRVTPIRYRPGARCALRYTLHDAASEQHFFGKLFGHDDSQRMAALPALYALTQQNAALPRLPQPLAYWPELQMLIQPVIAGAELHAVAFDPREPITVRLHWFSVMGAKLAALHRLNALDLPHRTVVDDLAELHSYTPIIERALPSLTSAYTATLQTLTTVAQHLPPVTPVVCHGALRTDQFLIAKPAQPTASKAENAEAELMLIDLDTLCLANPACDIGNCLAYLQWKAMRQPEHAGFIEQAVHTFLSSYTKEQVPPVTEWLTLYRALALLKIAGRRFRNLTYREWPLTPQLVQAAYTLMIPNQRNTRIASSP